MTGPSVQSGISRFAGYMIGFGLGGFFDGILLHQILQWHHLLSGLGDTRLNVYVLVFWDGIFHALMYVVTISGIYLLWRARKEFPPFGADRSLFARVLLGFSFWHIIDSVLSHWVLGIHRVRMDVENPLVWDLLWFVIFGILPLLIGCVMVRRCSTFGSRVNCSPASLFLAVMVAGPIASLPAPDQTKVMVLFMPGTSQQEALTAFAAVDANLIASDSSGLLWAIDMSPGGNSFELYRHGALVVTGAPLPLGCFNWTRA